MAEVSATIKLSNDEALVLFEFLARFCDEKKELAIEDASERRVLCDILCQLESFLVEPFATDYRDLLRRARSRVTQNR
jgi:hypothetical protein